MMSSGAICADDSSPAFNAFYERLKTLLAGVVTAELKELKNAKYPAHISAKSSIMLAFEVACLVVEERTL